VALGRRDSRPAPTRQGGYPLRDLLRQRVFGLACGYADRNDAVRLADDPIHKLLLDSVPLEGAALGSQPTPSLFSRTPWAGLHHWPWKSQLLDWSRGARRYTTK